jgi:glucose-1-phosphate thymidylyltransferase
MKGIVLAGGSGTRLYPVTRSVSKQLLPVYDKPMVYYPLSVLMLAGIREILIISTPQHLGLYRELLGDGAQWGVRFDYVEQLRPAGLPQAFTLGVDFIGDQSVCLVLGDNILYGHDLRKLLTEAANLQIGCRVFGYWVRDPERYGVAEIGSTGEIVDIVEKPKSPKSNYAITGIYFCDRDVVKVSRELIPSARGEVEITDVLRHYLRKGKLEVTLLGRGVAWLDTGTPESLLQAANFIEAIESRQGLKIACLEEIAYRQGWITPRQLEVMAAEMSKTAYGEYLGKILGIQR